MNLAEFNALKPGDKIEIGMFNTVGEVVEADKTGVRVKWDGVGLHPTYAGAVRHYSRYSTIWFHWSKVEADCPGLGKCEREDCRSADQCLGGSKADYDRMAGVAK